MEILTKVGIKAIKYGGSCLQYQGKHCVQWSRTQATESEYVLLNLAVS